MRPKKTWAQSYTFVLEMQSPTPFVAPTRQALQEGAVVVLDKPYGWTSFDVVRFFKKITGVKVGHAGTLDPEATGVLVLCTGSQTKRVSQLQAQEKEYTGTVVLGQTTPSLDAETEVSETGPFDHLNLSNLREAAPTFLGEQDQVPPIFSAKKLGGKRAYQFARNGEERELKPSKVVIFELDLIRFTLMETHAELDFRVVCSKGTYVRSLARDLALRAGTVGYLKNLRRTRSGSNTLDQALTIEQVRELYPNPHRTPTA
jgi:tRNA pseudouridine55 synthase